jgi:O-antigen/teichoic acid export membrane protein
MKISTFFFRSNQARDFSVYTLTSIVSQAIPFFLLPILTAYLSPEEYGFIGIYQVMTTFAIAIVGMGMAANITRNFYSKDQFFISRLISNLLIVLFVMTLLLFAGILIYNFFWGSLFGIPMKWMIVLPVIASMNLINQFNLTLFRNRKMPFRYGVLEIIKIILGLTISILLITVFYFGWEGRLYGILFSEIVLGIVGIASMYNDKYISPDFNWELIKEILVISAPLTFHTMSIAVLNLSDRLFIDRMLGKESVGLYTLGYQFGMIVLLVARAFNNVWGPWIYEQLSYISPDGKNRIVRFTYVYNFCFLCIAVGVTLLSYVLIKIMVSSKYYDGMKFIIWVALGYAFWAMYTMVYPYLVHVKKTHFLGIITVIVAIINLIANYLLIRANGAIGAAQATLLSYVILYVAVWIYAQHVYPMPWAHLFKRNNK